MPIPGDLLTTAMAVIPQYHITSQTWVVFWTETLSLTNPIFIR